MIKFNEIIVHCAATKPSMDIGAEWIRKIHINEKKYRDIGYHFVIRRNGAQEEGRPIDKAGAHCKGHNSDTIGICMVGGLSETGRPQNNFTPEQFQSIQMLIGYLKERYPTIVKLSGHNDYANRACPCFNVHEKLRL